jgi:hypothetical protein
MTSLKTITLAGFCALAAFGAAPNANANPISGTFALTIWSADTTNGGNGNDKNTCTSTACLALQNGTANNLLAQTSSVYSGSYTGAINFSETTGVDTIATFLATAGGTLTAGNTHGLGLGSTLSNGSFTHASLFDFLFTTTSTATYTVSHDDGFSIWNAGNSQEKISGFEGPTVDVANTFTLAAGTYNLWYAEANGLPADLVMQVPEPASMALLGVGMIGTGVMGRRRRQGNTTSIAG